MLLDSVTLTDFGTFCGQQTIDLRPKDGRPIVLLGGKNGVGKTTFLEAIRLGFYGQHWTGQRCSREQYLSHLDSRIHRNPTSLIQANSASVGIKFEYADIDRTHTYNVVRSWERKGNGRIDENLAIERDGQPLDDISTDHWQDFIRDLLPVGISQLFFFDGERIQHLADDQSDQETLAGAIKLLLGVDMIERLHSDLAIYASRALSTAKTSPADFCLQDCHNEVAQMESQAEEHRAHRTIRQQEIAELSRKIQNTEQRLSSSGASFAKDRDTLLAERVRVTSGIKEQEDTIRELCGALLPFALAPQVCADLKRQLAVEAETERNEIGRDLLLSAQKKVRTELRKALAARNVSATVIEAGLDCCTTAIQKLLPAKQNARLHDLSTSDRAKVLAWLDAANSGVNELIKEKSRILEQLYRKQSALETQLKSAPTDDALKPLIDELKSRFLDLGRLQSELAKCEESLSTTERLLSEARRRYERVAQMVSSQAARDARLALVPKIREALDEFKSHIIVRKIQELEKTVTACFNVLCRKKDAMRRIQIDSRTFAVTLINRDGQPVAKAQLSAGEKQIYAISMLWALARSSRRPLPVIIDTPLARLDRDHRELLALNYFPSASHQVIVLSTDTEVDEGYFELLRGNISQAYLLDFSVADWSTKMKPGYFWRHPHETHEAAAH